MPSHHPPQHGEPELNLGLRAWEGWEEKGPAEWEGKYLFNSSKTRSLPRNAPPVPHWLYWEKLKTIALRHTAGADVFNSSLLTSSSFSSPPAHPPILSAGIQQWECDGEGWSKLFPSARAIPLSSHPSLSHEPAWGGLWSNSSVWSSCHSCQVTFVNTV